MRSVRFVTVNSRTQRFDKFAPIREFHRQSVENCRNSYTLGEFVTIDEMLVSLRGQCGFIRHVRQEPATYGPKIYALCDARICILSI